MLYATVITAKYCLNPREKKSRPELQESFLLFQSLQLSVKIFMISRFTGRRIILNYSKIGIIFTVSYELLCNNFRHNCSIIIMVIGKSSLIQYQLIVKVIK